MMQQLDHPPTQAPAGSVPDTEALPDLPALLGLADLPTRALPANRPLPIDGTQRVWWVAEGKVDLFMVYCVNGERVGARHHVARVERGGLFPGIEFARDCPSWQVLAIGSPQTQVIELERAALHAALGGPDATRARQVLAHIERWLTALCGNADVEMLPQDNQPLEAGEADQRVILAPGGIGLVRSPLVWLRAVQGVPFFNGDPKWGMVPLAAPLALPRHVWLQAGSGPCALDLTHDGLPLLVADPDWGARRRRPRITLVRLAGRISAQEGDDRERLREREQVEQRSLRTALRGLSAVIEPGSLAEDEHAASDDPLLRACAIVGRHAHIRFVAPPPLRKGVARRDPLGDILRASHVRSREVRLAGDWWRRDNGHLLAFDQEGGRPLALIARASGQGYELHDPADGSAAPLDATRAAGVRPQARMFYRPFEEASLDVRSLMGFALAGRQRDLLVIGLMGLVMGLLGLVAPWATGQLIDNVIPHADRPQLLQLTMALVAVTFATALFGLSQSFAQLRTEGKTDAAVQAAVWDRLLNLPVPFFRQYSAGDLAVRANGISSIRQALSGTTLRSVLSSLFSVFSLFLMFAQNTTLALVGCALVVGVVAMSAAGSLLALRHERQLSELGGRLSGLLLQLLAGINKVRAAGAEARAFEQWARAYAGLQHSSQSAERIRNLMGVLNGGYPVFANIVIFAFIGVFNAAPGLSTGQFLVFSAAFGMLLGSMLTLTQTLLRLLSIIPIYERAKPILQTAPEIDAARADPGELDGRIDLNDVVFSYHPDLPPTLKGISLSVRAGEFLAVVGSSGSGKSTLLRLLLGFEQPQQGSIAYSDRDLGTIDLPAVRRQLGVVLQNGQLMDGDLFSNIVGSRPLGVEAAQEAVRQAGMEGDLAAMPMGLHTVVGDRGSTLSGGQRQRLLIAQAIVHKPRILFLDEATSALDHHTQQHVMHSFERLQATRIVIAHRLSTVVNADRIVVLHEGRIADQGRFDELMARDGLFAQMARRQMA